MNLFLKIYSEAMNYGSLLSIINKTNVKFIFKFGDPKVITYWILITPLNMSYTIITKAFVLKLKSLLPLIVRLKQTNFIKRKYILDNIIAI